MWIRGSLNPLAKANLQPRRDPGMATYTVTGHPLKMLPTTGTDAETIRALLQTAGVGATVTIALSGGDDTVVKGHGCLK